MPRPPERAATGPDWVDCGVYARAIQVASKGTVEVVLGWPADLYAGPVGVTVRHEYPQLVGKARTAEDHIWAEWPNKKHASLEALVYSLLYELDAKYAPNGVQLQLPFD